MTCFDKTQLTIDYDVCQVAFVVIQTKASAQGQRQHAETALLCAINLTYTKTQIPNCPNFPSGISSEFLIEISNKITGSVLAPWCVITKYESFSGSINQINCESCGSDVQWGFGPQTRISVSSDFRAEVLPLCLGDTLSATTDWVLHLFSLICGLMSLERHKKHTRKSPTQDSTLIPHKKLRAPKLNPALRHWESSSSASGGVALIVQADIYLMGGRYHGAGVEALHTGSCANTNTRRDSRACQCDSNLPLISVCFHFDQYLSHCGSHCYLPGATLFSPPVPPFGSVQLHHILLHKKSRFMCSSW